MKKLLVIILFSLPLPACSNNQVIYPSTQQKLTATLSNLHLDSASTVIEGDVAIENVSPDDISIATGVQAGTKGAFFSSRFEIFAVDSHGKTHKLYTPWPRYSFIGKLATITLPLPPQTTQTVHVLGGLTHGHGDDTSLLPTGAYTFYVQFAGKKHDTECPQCWTGSIRSNEVQLDIP